MKNIIKIFLGAALVLAAASCSLDEKVYTQTDATYIKDAKMAENLLFGVYDDLQRDGVYRQNLPFLFNLPTDEGKTEGSSLTAHRAEGSNAFGPNSPYVEESWRDLFKAVYDANYYIETIPAKAVDFSEKDQEICRLYVAEAHALRALAYFELVRWFGHVPLVKTTAEADKPADEFKQADPAEVYAFIEEDLKYAIDVLPYAKHDNVRPHTEFRISKGSALGLLTKVYATWAGAPLNDKTKWPLAAQTAETLISSGEHALLSDFQQLWKNSASNVWNPAESLIELSYWSPLSTNESSGRVGNYNGVRCAKNGLRNGGHGHNVFYFFNPTFLTGWKDYDKDKRFALTYADYEYKPGGPQAVVRKTVDGVKDSDVTFLMAFEGTHPDWNQSWRSMYSFRLTNRKWDTEIYVPDENYLVDNSYTNINWYVLRYADVLLLYAEALNEVNQGPVPEAYKAVNMVRRRGFGLDVNEVSAEADLEEGLDYAGFQKAIRQERGWELAGEGHRRQDLVRWGIYYETVNETYQNLGDWDPMAYKYYLGGIYTQKNKHELLPIPQREVDLSKYEQNIGW